ncbi:unnamed protein product, partial [Prorocentrum cordatum]
MAVGMSASTVGMHRRSVALCVGAAGRALEVPVLVYPGLDARDWQRESTCGWYNVDACMAGARPLLHRQGALLGGDGFAAPPTLLVASRYDETCPPETNSDLYAKALAAAGVPHRYLLDDYGRHGFALDGGWTDACIDWLASAGIG